MPTSAALAGPHLRGEASPGLQARQQRLCLTAQLGSLRSRGGPAGAQQPVLGAKPACTRTCGSEQHVTISCPGRPVSSTDVWWGGHRTGTIRRNTAPGALPDPRHCSVHWQGCSRSVPAACMPLGSQGSACQGYCPLQLCCQASATGARLPMAQAENGFSVGTDIISVVKALTLRGRQGTCCSDLSPAALSAAAFRPTQLLPGMMDRHSSSAAQLVKTSAHLSPLMWPWR